MTYGDPECISFRARGGFLLLAWAVAYLGAVVLSGAGLPEGFVVIAALPWLPLGLCDLLRIVNRDVEVVIVLATWLAYIVLSVSLVAVRRIPLRSALVCFVRAADWCSGRLSYGAA